jgi:hypothetical protein
MLVCVDARGRNTCSAAFNRKCLIKSDRCCAATGRCKIAFSAAAAARTGCLETHSSYTLVAISDGIIFMCLFLEIRLLCFLRAVIVHSDIEVEKFYFVSENKMSIVSTADLAAKKFESQKL